MVEMQTRRAERRGMRDMRTAVTARVRSKPMIEGQRYLDLYVLQRDRFRWQRLKDQAEKSMDNIDQALVKLGFLPDSGARDRCAPAKKGGPAGTNGGSVKSRQVAPRRSRRA